MRPNMGVFYERFKNKMTETTELTGLPN